MGAVMRLCHKATSQAFGQWREYVSANKVLGEQQRSAMQHMEVVRLQQCWDRWRHSKAQKQQHQVSIGILASQRMPGVACLLATRVSSAV